MVTSKGKFVFCKTEIRNNRESIKQSYETTVKKIISDSKWQSARVDNTRNKIIIILEKVDVTTIFKRREVRF